LATESVNSLIFGVHPILEALRGAQKLERLYVSNGRKGKVLEDILRLAKRQGVEVRFEPWERLTARVQSEAAVRTGVEIVHQGVVGLAATYPYVEFKELLAIAQKQSEPPFLLVLDQIQDPHNLGAILRSAECAGVHGIILPKHKAASVTPTVVKVSAGAAAYLPVCRVTNLADTLAELQKNRIWVVGAVSTAPQLYDQIDFVMPVAIVIGNEEKGLRRLVAEQCDFVTTIPLYGKIASLNASVASAILMFEARRQRKIKKAN
jgi:23S rRNA (guanosine2251-2'-O)-methyltransferase